MSLELVVDSRQDGIWLALLRDGKLIELHQEQGNTEFAVGDIYLGKVRKTVPSLNAAFVDVGYEKDAFLHYLDLGPQFNSLNKFTKDTLHGKQSVADLQYFKLEGEIPKEGQMEEAVSSTQPIFGSSCQRTNFNKRTSLKCRNHSCRSLYRFSTFL